MNKRLPTTPKKDDILGSFDALTLAGGKPSLATPKKRDWISRFNPFNLKKRSQEDDDLVSSFDSLNVAGTKAPTPDKNPPDASVPPNRPASQHSFVGGFNPGLLALNVEPLPQSRQVSDQHTRIPMPVPQAVKQSLTMQHALQPDTPENDTPAPAAPPPQSSSDSISSPPYLPKPRLPEVGTAPIRPAYPVTPDRKRSASVPHSFVTSSPEGERAQCCGTIKSGRESGRQCLRTVKLPPTHYYLDPIPDIFCHDHEPDIDRHQRFYPRRDGIQRNLVEFSHFIPHYLQTKTRVTLKTEMEKETTPSDCPGFVYAFEIRDSERPDMIQIKVGRTGNLNKRFHEWDKQCKSEHIVRGWWPGSDGGSLLKGNIKQGKPGPFSYRVERLVHIELRDLSLNAPYLTPGWPNKMTAPVSPNFSRPRHSPKATPCVGCGVMHEEIFTFPRPKEGPYKDMEWDLIVKPVIEKWGKFVEEHYA